MDTAPAGIGEKSEERMIHMYIEAVSLKAPSHSTQPRCKLLRLAEIHNIVRVAASWRTHNYYNDGLAMDDGLIYR